MSRSLVSSSFLFLLSSLLSLLFSASAQKGGGERRERYKERERGDLQHSISLSFSFRLFLPSLSVEPPTIDQLWFSLDILK
mmetsp:Transcript_42306/g.83440  ORF Transcript_42306/g.83440 Transcript_42306/m.83440 type:complete len:81 (-) Transcript_42306:454-696(-)